MLDFKLDEEQEMLAAAIHRFAQERVRAVFRDADEEGALPADVVRAGWELGVIPAGLPEAYGGFGDHSAVNAAVAVEELAWGDLALAAHVLAPGAVAMPILLSGTEAQKEAHLPVFAEEAPPPVAAALVEPRLQFDPRALATTAVRDGDEYRLSGEKCVVPLADRAESFLVYAAEGDQTQAFFVPATTDGLTVGERDKLMGLRGLPTYRLHLDNCRVPAVNRLGGDTGLDVDRILNHGRVTMGAAAVGVARAGYEYAREYAKQRVQFGEPIAHRQSIAFMLAEMAIDIDAARLMVWEAAWLLDRGEDATGAVAVMKHFVDDMVVRVADQALQVLGGYGYIREYPVELWLRNARGFVALESLIIA